MQSLSTTRALFQATFEACPASSVKGALQTCANAGNNKTPPLTKSLCMVRTRACAGIARFALPRDRKSRKFSTPLLLSKQDIQLVCRPPVRRLSLEGFPTRQPCERGTAALPSTVWSVQHDNCVQVYACQHSHAFMCVLPSLLLRFGQASILVKTQKSEKLFAGVCVWFRLSQQASEYVFPVTSMWLCRFIVS